MSSDQKDLSFSEKSASQKINEFKLYLLAADSFIHNQQIKLRFCDGLGSNLISYAAKSSFFNQELNFSNFINLRFYKF